MSKFSFVRLEEGHWTCKSCSDSSQKFPSVHRPAYAGLTVKSGTNRQSTNSSALLKHYHWLPIHLHIKFKIACITYKTIHTTQPAYLNSVLEHYTNSYIAFI